MTEDKIRREVDLRVDNVHVEPDWYTPSGKRRSAPMWVAKVSNHYVGKVRDVKAKTEYEARFKANECLEKWKEQEIRKRVVAAKRDTKEKAQAEAARLDQEAKRTQGEMKRLLEATIAIDDTIDWDAERDTREYPAFAFPPPPPEPAPELLTLPPKPGLTWLLKGRTRRWELACEEAKRFHAQTEEYERTGWEKAVAEHSQERANAEQQHDSDRLQFLADQERFNSALAEHRKQFESGNAAVINDYCSGVLERSQYPESINLTHSLEFDAETGYVAIDLEMPSPESVPSNAGYKFVAKGNSIEPISLTKKDAKTLYESVLDQLTLRTIHEILESCYIETVTGVVLNGYVTRLDPATGRDKRERLRCVAADRITFESLDLSRIDPAACIRKLAESVGQIDGTTR